MNKFTGIDRRSKNSLAVVVMQLMGSPVSRSHPMIPYSMGQIVQCFFRASGSQFAGSAPHQSINSRQLEEKEWLRPTQ
ncbi:hypothetical protein [Paraburkholderia fynbosensis]|uniref:hypothetical protein n=1 Tax=Paraburkholderia fynbosensis TaxID=1200993 RepID=UPI001581BFD9|nr:hypothetical protein [Paraburkholderia fynbosensis]